MLVNQLAYIVIVNLGYARRQRRRATCSTTASATSPTPTRYLIFILPHSIITVSVVTGLLPRMSRAAADGDLAAVRDDALRRPGGSPAVGVVVAAAGLVALGPELTGVLYASSGADGRARYIGLLTAAFALGLPAFSAQYVALRGFYAFEDTRTPFLLQVAIAATNVVLALAAYAVLPLRWRMVGVALAYSVDLRRSGWPCPPRCCAAGLGGLDGRRRGPALRPAGGRRGPRRAAGLGRVAGPSATRLGDGFGGSLVALAAGGVVLLGGLPGAGAGTAGRELDRAARTGPGPQRGLTRPDRGSLTGPWHGRRPHDAQGRRCPADVQNMLAVSLRAVRAGSSHDTPVDDRGDIVLGWLTKLTVIIAIAGSSSSTPSRWARRRRASPTRAPPPPCEASATWDRDQEHPGGLRRRGGDARPRRTR